MSLAVDGTISGTIAGGTAGTVSIINASTNDIVFLGIAINSATSQTVSTITTSGATWTKRKTTSIAGQLDVEEWYTTTGSAGTYAATITISAAATVSVVGISFSGGITSGPFDPNGSLPYGNNSVSTATISAATITTTNPVDMLIGFTAWRVGSGATITASAGYTLGPKASSGAASNAGITLGVEYKSVSTSGLSTQQPTLNEAAAWGILADAITAFQSGSVAITGTVKTSATEIGSGKISVSGSIKASSIEIGSGKVGVAGTIRSSTGEIASGKITVSGIIHSTIGTSGSGRVLYGTANATITPSATASGTVIVFGSSGEVNQVGHVLSTDNMVIYHSGTTIPAFDINTNRSISIAGSLQFKTPRAYGLSINLFDRVEAGYKGHESFYGWVYSIDKSNENIYQVTAYDGGYGLAQVVSSAGDVANTSTLSTSLLLGLFALQVQGLGVGKTDFLGVDYSANTVNTVFGWGFSSGQVLQKLESIMLGTGYVSVVDYLSNLTLSNYQYVSTILSTIMATVSVGTITLKENTDLFVVQSKQFNPATEYGKWTVTSIGTNSATITASTGSGKPSRTLGGNWLLLTNVATTLISTISAEYQSIFQNGVWVVTAWSPYWFETSGVDLGGSISSYIGDGNYAITSVGTIGIVISSISNATSIATLSASGVQGATYIRNPQNPIFACVKGTQIAEYNKLTVPGPTQLLLTGTAGTLTGRSIDYDGLNTMYTAVSGGTVWASDFYLKTSSAVATIGGTINTIIAPSAGVAYVGTSGGVVNVSTGATITGTSGNVPWLFADSVSGLVYVCTGSTLLPFFPVGGGSTTGTFSVQFNTTLGCASNDGTNRIFLSDSRQYEMMQYGSNLAWATLSPVTVTATDMTYDVSTKQLVATLYDSNLPVAVSLRMFNVGTNTVTFGTNCSVCAGTGTTARTVNAFITRQNLYNLQFQDGTFLYNAIIATVQVAQAGVTVTFQGSATIPTAFVGPTDVTQLVLWNVVSTNQQ